MTIDVKNGVVAHAAHATDTVHELFRLRQSRRAFDPTRQLSDEDLYAVLEAARWAPSGGNGQPWRYVIARKGDPNYETLFALLQPGNQAWAKHASALMITIAQVLRARPDGTKASNRTALHDLGMANLSIALEATHRGMNVRMMGGYDADTARKLIHAEENGFDVGPMLAIGYLANDSTQVDEDLRQKDAAPRARKPLEEMVLELERGTSAQPERALSAG